MTRRTRQHIWTFGAGLTSVEISSIGNVAPKVCRCVDGAIINILPVLLISNISVNLYYLMFHCLRSRVFTTLDDPILHNPSP